MSRRHAAQKREVIPDPKFNDLVVTKFMNAVMEDGKKSVAERMVYGAFDKMEQPDWQAYMDKAMELVAKECGFDPLAWLEAA